MACGACSYDLPAEKCGCAEKERPVQRYLDNIGWLKNHLRGKRGKGEPFWIQWGKRPPTPLFRETKHAMQTYDVILADELDVPSVNAHYMGLAGLPAWWLDSVHLSESCTLLPRAYFIEFVCNCVSPSLRRN